MNGADKIMDSGALRALIEDLRGQDKSVALTNGLFDLLHVGHLRYLEAASREADILVVAVNSDDSAHKLKGPERPVTPERERAELVAGFGCVDYVAIFSDNNVEGLLRLLQPAVHCKGTDYTVDSVPEAEVARELGIRTAIVGDPKDHATREIIDRLRKEQS